jgi:hypothetical protein
MDKRLELVLAGKAMLPGKLEEHYNVCGKPGCRCKDKADPQMHGPYHRLSYSVRGRNSSVHVPAGDAEMVGIMTDNYRAARAGAQDLALEMVAAYREGGLEKALERHVGLAGGTRGGADATKPESQRLREALASRDKWRAKALERQSALRGRSVRVRDLEASRGGWKRKAAVLGRENAGLKRRISELEKGQDGPGECPDNKKNSGP